MSMFSLPCMNRFFWAAGVATAGLVLLGALVLYTPQALAGGPTPTPEPTLTWTFDVSPASPVVGDDIKLTAYASGSGGLPQYTLVLEDDPALVALESSASVSTSMLGVPKSWDLGTLGEGEAHFHININYEREICNPTCFFEFTFDASPQMTFVIGAGEPVVGGSASLPLLESGAPASRGYVAIQIALITASAIFGVGALAWLVRRTVLRRGAS